MRRIEKSFSLICDKAKKVQKGLLLEKDHLAHLLLLAETFEQYLKCKKDKLMKELKLIEAKFQLVENARKILKRNIDK